MGNFAATDPSNLSHNVAGARDCPVAGAQTPEWVRRMLEWRPSAQEKWVLASVIALLMVLRGYNLFTDAAFWCDDGPVFFAPAFNGGHGERLIFTPVNSYFNVIPRAAAYLASLAPLRDAPAVMAGVALLVDALPAVLLLSDRLDSFASPVIRVFAAVMYAITPYPEAFGNACEAHFIVWPAMVAVLMSAPSKGLPARGVDLAILVVLGLSGPEVTFVCVAGWLCRSVNLRVRLPELLVASLCALLELAAIHQATSAYHSGRVLIIRPYTVEAMALMIADVAATGFQPDIAWRVIGVSIFIVNAAIVIRERDRFRVAILIASLFAAFTACTTFDSGNGAGRYHVYAAVAFALLYPGQRLLQPRSWMDTCRFFYLAALLLNYVALPVLIPPSHQTIPSWTRQVDGIYEPAPVGSAVKLGTAYPGWSVALYRKTSIK